MTTGSPRPAERGLVALGVFLGICLAVSAAGGWVTAQSVGTWYRALAKPAFNPPDWVFAPVWTALYLMIAVAGWRIWRARGSAGAGPAMFAYGVQLALNLGWSFLFFGGRMIGLALAEITLLLAAIVVTAARFRRIDPVAAWLLVPYAGWVAFAALLNLELWRLN